MHDFIRPVNARFYRWLRSWSWRISDTAAMMNEATESINMSALLYLGSESQFIEITIKTLGIALRTQEIHSMAATSSPFTPRPTP